MRRPAIADILVAMTDGAQVELVVVCYDVADDRRRQRLVRVLESFGQRVQESVFECWLNAAQQRALERRATAELDEGRDLLAIYALARIDARDAICIGGGAELTRDTRMLVL